MNSQPPRSSAKVPICPHATTCAMFPLFTVNNLLNVWKVNFCQADYSRCARFQRSEKGEKVPKNLLPTGKLLRLPDDPSDDT